MSTATSTASPAALATTYEALPANIRDTFCPPATYDAKKRLSWIRRFLETSQKNLEASANYKRLCRAVDALYNGTEETSPSGRISNTSFNRTKRQTQKLVATLSDISPAWNYDTNDKSLDDPAVLLTKLFEALWQHPNTRTRKSLIELFQYASTGEGYLSPVWETDYYTHLNGEIGFKLKPYALDSVYHTQISQDKDLQRCYAVGILNETPLSQAAMLYPEHIEFLHTSAKPVSFFKRLGKKITTALAGSVAIAAAEEDRQRYYGNGSGGYDSQMQSLQEDQAIEIYDIYLQDCSINRSKSRVKMGREGTSEYYEVPYLGEPLPTGANNVDGSPITRPANANEALLYPYRRRIICTRDHIIYDGPSPWLHGKVPLVRFAPDDWPWDEVASPLALESHGLNTMVESLFRGMHDKVNLALDPPLKMPTTMSKKTAESLNMRKPGERVHVDPFDSTKVEPIHPPQLLTLDPAIIAAIQETERESDFIVGEADMRSLAQAAQVPSAETVDRFLQNISPLATMISRNIEDSLLRIGDMTKFLLLQYATADLRLRIFGRDGLLCEDFDWKPGTMVPVSQKTFPTTYSDQLRTYARKFYFNIVPGSAYRITDQQRQLMLFQLWRDPEFPLGPWTLAKAFNIKIGEPPQGLKSELDQYFYFKKQTADFMIAMQAQAQVTMAAAQLRAQEMAMQKQGEQMMNGLGALGMLGGMTAPPAANGEQVVPPPPLQQRAQGRPPTAQAAPSLENKVSGGEQRQTISET